MHMHHIKSAPARIVPDQSGFLKSVTLHNLDCSYNPSIIKNEHSFRVLHGKNGPKTSITISAFFCKVPSLWVVMGQMLRVTMYELWYHNNQAQSKLIYNLGPPTMPSTTCIPTYNHLHGKELFAWKLVWHQCSRMTFSCRYTVMCGGYLGTINIKK